MFNEEANARRCVEAVCEVIRSKAAGSKLIVVDDGSSDGTANELSQIKENGGDILAFDFVSHSENQGYGGALVTGMRKAFEDGFEFGLVMDSDLTNDPDLIPLFVEKLATGKYDLVKASRYIPGGGMKGVSLYRKAYTIIGNAIASLLFNMGIKDCTNGFHAVRLSMVVDSQFSERGFPFLLEELYLLKRRGAIATEIPYVLTARTSDKGESKFTYSPKVLWTYLKYALKASLTPKIEEEK